MSAAVRTSPTKTPTAATASKAEFARQMGVTRQTVSTWISRKQLRWPALRRDGRINPEGAKAMLAGEARGFGRERAAGRQTVVAEGATSARLTRARSRVLEIAAESREFDPAIAAGLVISVEDASRELSRVLGDLSSMVEAWTMSVPNQVLAAADDRVALDRVRASFDQAWHRARTVP